MDDEVFVNAIRSCSIPTLQSLVTRADSLCVDCEPCLQSIRQGRLDVLQWLRREGWPWDERCAEAACCFHGTLPSLELVEWVVQQGCPLPVDLLLTVVRENNVDVLRLLQELGCRCDPAVLAEALRQYDTFVRATPAQPGSEWSAKKVVLQLINTGCPLPEDIALDDVPWSADILHPLQVRQMVQGIMWRVPRTHAACVLQSRWKQCYYVPDERICRKRIVREFERLQCADKRMCKSPVHES